MTKWGRGGKSWSVRGGGILLLVLAVLSLPAASVLAAASFVYPAPGTWVSKSQYLVIKLGSDSLTSTVVTVNGVASDHLPVGTPEYRRAFRDFLILQPVWDGGKNTVTVDTFIAGKKQDSSTMDIFYAPAEQKLPIPANYRRAVMHLPESDSLCTPCHNMRPTAAQVNNALDKDNACYTCHRRMANGKYVHGPVSTYSCAYCHTLQGMPRYAPVKREAELCFECHIDLATELKKRKFLHGPVAADMCELCHDSHGSENPGQLKMPINKLCLSCHEKIGKELHVTTLNDGAGHPLDGKNDPSERGKGKILSCVSCHNPHGGDARFYFHTNSDDRMALCQYCHKK